MTAFSTVNVDYITSGADADTVAEDIRIAVTGRLNAGWSLIGTLKSNFTIFLIFEKRHE